MDNYSLFDLLLKAESEDDVEKALEKAGYLADDSNFWRPFGGFGMNLNTINNPAVRRHGRIGREAHQLYRCRAHGGVLSARHRSQKSQGTAYYG